MCNGIVLTRGGFGWSGDFVKNSKYNIVIDYSKFLGITSIMSTVTNTEIQISGVFSHFHAHQLSSHYPS